MAAGLCTARCCFCWNCHLNIFSNLRCIISGVGSFLVLFFKIACLECIDTQLGPSEYRVADAIFYSWLDFVHEDPGTQLEMKLYWSAFLKTTVLFCSVVHPSLNVRSNSTSNLKMPSMQGSLLCSTCVESSWDFSGINKFLKATC